jgi:Na+-driven multidrug efflux pump
VVFSRAQAAALLPDMGIVRQSLGGGTLVGLQYALISAASLALMGLVNRYGSATAAAYGVAVTIWSYIQMPIQSVAGAASAIAAQSVGASEHGRVRRIAWVACAANFALTGVTIVICYALNERLVNLFLPGQSKASAIAIQINSTVLWSFLLLAITMVLFGVLRAANDMAVPFAIILVSHIIVRVPFAYLLAPEYGPAAIWWSYPVGLAVALLITLAYVTWRPPWAPKQPSPDAGS